MTSEVLLDSESIAGRFPARQAELTAATTQLILTSGSLTQLILTIVPAAVFPFEAAGSSSYRSLGDLTGAIG